MDFRTFEQAAHEAFEAIPPEFREGIDGLDVSRETVAHPDYPDVYTLGECLTEEYPTEFGGVGEVRSVVVLYYGSFLALSRLDEDFDWEDEVFETVTHEVRHHLESLAADDSLEELDYAQDQNFARRYGAALDGGEERRGPRAARHPVRSPAEGDAAEEGGYAGDQNSARREGEPFDPFFFRSGVAVPEGGWEVDGDHFVEVPVPRGAATVLLRLGGRAWTLPVPRPLGDVHFLTLRGAEWDRDAGEVVAVLVRRRGVGEWIGSLLGGRGPEVLWSEVELEP